MATGNATADLYKLNTGKIEVGREADLQVIDNPPGSVGTDALKAIENGDPFGNSMVIVDGRIIAYRGKDSRPTARYCKIDGENNLSLESLSICSSHRSREGIMKVSGNR